MGSARPKSWKEVKIGYFPYQGEGPPGLVWTGSVWAPWTPACMGHRCCLLKRASQKLLQCLQGPENTQLALTRDSGCIALIWNMNAALSRWDVHLVGLCQPQENRLPGSPVLHFCA